MTADEARQLVANATSQDAMTKKIVPLLNECYSEIKERAREGYHSVSMPRSVQFQPAVVKDAIEAQLRKNGFMIDKTDGIIRE